MTLATWVLVIVIHTYGTGAATDPSDGVALGVVPFATKEDCLAQRPGIIAMIEADTESMGGKVRAMCVPTGAKP